MTNTPIEWTDFAVNPIRFRNKETGKVGHFCEKVSPGCKNCYSDKMQTGPYLSGLAFIAENADKGELFFDEAVLQKVLKRRKPARIFWCDMTDLFGRWVPDEWIDRCFAVMALTPHLTHQVLTKRADRMREYFAGVAEDPDELVMRWGSEAGCLLDGDWIWNEGKRYRSRIERFISWSHGLEEDCETQVTREHAVPFPLPNVWLGGSVEDQQRADERIPMLLQTPAAVRFLSVEPLLGPVDLGLNRWVRLPRMVVSELPFPNLDWVIVGGESGPGARPCDVAHVRSIVTQCQAAGVPVFVKQLGARPCDWQVSASCYAYPQYLDPKGGDPEEWPADLRVREMPKPLEESRA
jgi:protein gp37